LCEVNNVRKIFFDCEKTSQSQKGVRNMGILRYTWKQSPPILHKPLQIFHDTGVYTRYLHRPLASDFCEKNSNLCPPGQFTEFKESVKEI
jgi:hypothetical protein